MKLIKLPNPAMGYSQAKTEREDSVNDLKVLGGSVFQVNEVSLVLEMISEV